MSRREKPNSDIINMRRAACKEFMDGCKTII